jgi:spore maturation protein CgeB
MPLPEAIDYKLYDMVVSSFPPTIDWLRARGVRAELNRLAFDPRVAAFVPDRPRDIRVSFAGSFLPVHRSRLELIEAVAAKNSEISVHGAVAVDLAPLSPLAGKIKPALWGRDMYALLARSMITLNHHGDVPPFANNMRLYEATGMGCLLVTDYKENLEEMFEPDREVVAYRDAAECVDKVLFYLDDRNSTAREKIASAGQKRTLREHTYQARMKHLVDLVRTI